MFQNSIWKNLIWGNSLEQYLLAISAFIFFLLLFKLLQTILITRLERIAKKTISKSDDVFIRIISSIKPPFYYFLALYFSVKFLTVTPFVEKTIHSILEIWIVVQLIFCVQVFVDFLVRRSLNKEQEKSARAAISLVKIVTSIVLWVIGLLFLFSNLGINVTSLIAGFGISGIAIALAVQNILRDLLSSFAIFFDKPFVVGDYIKVGMDEGVVKQIGVKTTRLKSLGGEEIIISNQELTSVRIQNFSRLKDRRVSFILKVDLKTEPEKIEKIKSNIQNIIAKHEEAEFERANIDTFDGASLSYEIVYFIKTETYQQFVSTKEKILLEILQCVDEEKVKIV